MQLGSETAPSAAGPPATMFLHTCIYISLVYQTLVFCVRIHIGLYTIATVRCYAFYQCTRKHSVNFQVTCAQSAYLSSCALWSNVTVHELWCTLQTNTCTHTLNTLCILLVHLCTSHVLKLLWVGACAYNTIVYTHCCSLLPALLPTPQDSGLHCSHWL